MLFSIQGRGLSTRTKPSSRSVVDLHTLSRGVTGTVPTTHDTS
jgi:hypothetical protein